MTASGHGVRRRPLPAGVVVAAVPALTAGLVAVLVAGLALGGALPGGVAPGLSDPGEVTRWGVPVAHLASVVGAVGAAGSLLFAAVLHPGDGRRLRGPALSAVRAASTWAVVWATASAVHAVLSVSLLSGVPATGLAPQTLVANLRDLPPGRADAVVVTVALVVASLAWRATSVPAARGLLVAALAGVTAPQVLAGHAASSGDHVLAVSTLSLHVLAAALWVGGLLALVLHAPDRPEPLAATAGRFSRLALVLFAATGASGLLGAWVVLRGTPGFPLGALGSGYGALLAVKTGALVGLGALGLAHRRRTLPQLAAGRSRAFLRLALAEAAVMVATLGLAAALAQSPPPAAAGSAAAEPEQQSAAGRQDGAAEDMSGHDHGDLSVGVLVDEARFHVPKPVAAGQPVTVFNDGPVEVTITADDGSFDRAVGPGSLVTFTAPDAPGQYRFTSRHDPTFTDVLVVR